MAAVLAAGWTGFLIGIVDTLPFRKFDVLDIAVWVM